MTVKELIEKLNALSDEQKEWQITTEYGDWIETIEVQEDYETIEIHS